MSVARIRHFLHATGRRLASHRGAVASATVFLAVTALGLGFSFAALTGLAVVVALLGSIVASVPWLRIRAVERSHATLVVSMAELTARLERFESSSISALSDFDSGFLIADPAVAAGANPTALDPETAAQDAPAQATVADGDSVTVNIDHEQMPDEAVVFEAVSQLVSAVVIDQSEQDHESAGTDDVHGDTDQAITVESATVVGTGQDEQTDDDPVTARHDDFPSIEPGDAAGAIVPEQMPGFALTSLRGDTVTDADLVGRPAVVVFWRPGCEHSRRLTPELVAWESLQGPSLIMIAACDGPTAYRAGLPGLVVLDPSFSVGQALGAPGTPAALPLDGGGRPTGPVVTGSSAVTTLLLDAMRDWASAEPELIVDEPGAGLDVDSDDDLTAREPVGQDQRRPTVLLRRVEKLTSTDGVSNPDWDAEPATRRVG